ncbi:MAG: hypothetical protein GW779_01430 [Candidatus Altiarchaeum hamiconexum]|uniref:DUF5678 domain-containing protein n=1 Tax=Candidatus Altarchaeum hamiconexum TaxID=1803513 RepID=A0A8J7YTV0_9ARCH|nr:hypothetical protein [Candidatus Altarchaeum hamiconexum]NCN68646.1 hypothetical protein [Candidatus Altarchaeum hamiconexum]NCS91072.1 hypothetical protein [Candidatus Altarchaeum hamiconexum]NCT00907.1 hypothetical protein [Candidatus Altarchaeum hamiconexum]
MDKTFNWFTKADLSKYKGKYGYVVGSKVVGADDDSEKVYCFAKKIPW